MIYFTNTLRAEWLPLDSSYTILGEEVFPYSNIESEAMACAKELQFAHSLVYDLNEWVEWLFESMNLTSPYHPSQHPFGFSLSKGDIVYIALWRGHLFKKEIPIRRQVNKKSLRYVTWQRLSIG